MMRRIAGELDSQQLGKIVEVTFASGNITSTVRDVIEKITHESEGVRLHFRSTKWMAQVNLFSVATDQGLLVSPNSYVTIVDD